MIWFYEIVEFDNFSDNDESTASIADSTPLFCAMHSSQKFFSRFWSLWQKDRKSCKILSMNAISPVAPVLDVIFHFREIMKFHDHKNPVSEWSYVGLFWLRFLEVLELLWEWWESPSSGKDAVSGSQTLRLLRRRTDDRSKPALDCLDFMPWKYEIFHQFFSMKFFW